MNMISKILGLATAVSTAALVLTATGAQASTYSLGTLTPGLVSTASTATVGSGVTSNDFTFTLDAPYETYAIGGYIGAAPFGIDSAVLTLYSDVAPTVPITSISYDPETQVAPTLTADLGTGSYYIASTVTAPNGLLGGYTVDATVMSAAPEPEAWAMMLMGVGVVGVMLRLRRRQNGDLDGLAADAV
jgi:hypothetical protein